MSMLFEHWWLPHLATTGHTVLLIERRPLIKSYKGMGDMMDSSTWDYPDVVILGSPASDLRIQEISDYLETKPHQH